MSKISLIVPVLNEANNIQRLIDSILRQTRLPDQIIFCDGGSQDETVNLIEAYATTLPITVLSAPATNISVGRNLAIQQAHGDIICATDAGLYLASDWVESLTAPLRNNPEVHVVSGFFEVDAHSYFEIAMGALVTRLLDEINPAIFLPGSRSIAFRRSLWVNVGGYPEWLDYGEDLVFVLKVKALVGNFEFVPAKVYFQPRSSVRGFYRQYFNYATGDGRADLWRTRHTIRYGTYLILIPLITILALIIHPTLIILYFLGGAIYLRKPYRRLVSGLRHKSVPLLIIIYLAALIPILRMVGDVAKMAGYIVGWRWRWQNKPEKWR